VATDPGPDRHAVLNTFEHCYNRAKRWDDGPAAVGRRHCANNGTAKVEDLIFLAMIYWRRRGKPTTPATGVIWPSSPPRTNRFRGAR